MDKNQFHAAVFVFLVLCSLLLFYTAYDKKTKTLEVQKLFGVLSFSDFSLSLSELNKVAALAAIGLVSFAFIVGPLSKMFPKAFARFLAWRKLVGISGFGLALLHSVYSLLVIYEADLQKIVFENPKLLGFAAGLIALAIFFFMAITSTVQAVKKMGYPKWKALQTTGYVALFLAIAHFIILEIKPDKGFDVRPYGVVFLFVAIGALALRIGAAFVKTKPRQSFEEHVGHTLQNKQ